ncbi:DUF4349 domain-containing protein [Agromyces salentinus]|uniref:DUF4349 domain-containing protein n=1 Tax=Agromyces salentinus TaxID=269421 RepID=A0ABN2MTJ8_9MICO|nr:DUF4349 domain-containing protein [Agromyces salentinus]
MRATQRIVPPRTSLRFASSAALALVAAALLGGCSMGAGSDAASTAVDPAIEAPMPDQAPEQFAGGAELGEASDADGGAEAGAEAPEDRSVVTTGWVAITVEDPVAAAADVAELTARADGRVDDRTERPGTDTQSASASLVIRVPSDGLDAVLDELRDLGDVTSVQLSATDVTVAHQDLEARIGALTASVTRMRALLAEAADIGDLIAIESELTTRQGELDGLTQQRAQLDDQIAYSTVSVELGTEDTAPSPAPEGFWGGLVAGWTGLLWFLGWLGVALGVILPWVLAATVVVAIVLGIVRLAQAPARRREREAGAARDPEAGAAREREAVAASTTGDDPTPRA